MRDTLGGGRAGRETRRRASSVDQAVRRARRGRRAVRRPRRPRGGSASAGCDCGRAGVERRADRVGGAARGPSAPRLPGADVEVVRAIRRKPSTGPPSWPYGNQGALLRVTLTDGGRTLVLAAHHGAIDGLACSEWPPLYRTAADAGCARCAAGRRAGRLRPAQPEAGWRRRSSPHRCGSLPRLAAATVTGCWRVRWSLRTPARPPSVLAATERCAPGTPAAAPPVDGRCSPLGLSRRPGDPRHRRPTRHGLLRVRVAAVGTREEAPAWSPRQGPSRLPETPTGAAGGRVSVRLLSSRLGSTTLVSNLGLVAHDGVERVTSGPSRRARPACRVGAGQQRERHLGDRARPRSWFDRAQAARRWILVAEQVERAGR